MVSYFPDIDKPVIKLSPEKPTILSNSSIILQCMVNASHPVIYKWFFNKTEIFGETSSTLLKNRIQPSESGLYECEVALGELKKRSENVHIKVVCKYCYFASLAETFYVNFSPGY